MRMSRKAKLAYLASLSLTLAAQQAHAVIDVTAVTTGITDAQTAITAIVTALLALSVALFGLVKVYSFVKRRAGA